MKLYLVRHGSANPADVDPQKGLSDIGKKEITTLAALVKHLNIRVTEIYHSGKARAEQTAEILSIAIKSKNGLSARGDLEPNDPVEKIAVEIISAGRDTMLVGHLPFMAKLASYLLSGNPDKCALNFSTGAMACLDYQEKKWSLSWFINPDINPIGEIGHFESYH